MFLIENVHIMSSKIQNLFLEFRMDFLYARLIITRSFGLGNLQTWCKLFSSSLLTSCLDSTISSTFHSEAHHHVIVHKRLFYSAGYPRWPHLHESSKATCGLNNVALTERAEKQLLNMTS